VVVVKGGKGGGVGGLQVKELVRMHKFTDKFLTFSKHFEYKISIEAQQWEIRKQQNILYLFGNRFLCSLMHSCTHNFQRYSCNYRHHAYKDC